VTDRLRPIWDFDDLDGTERRFQELLVEEEDDEARAEVLTQLARIHGLRGDFDAGEQLIQEAQTLGGSSGRVGVRVDLERGRLLRSGGDPEAAFPLFVSAFENARRSGELFLAGDAAHMAAIAAPTSEERLEWAERGLDLADSGDGSGRYWAGPLLNNLGWDQFESGEYERALDTFRRALAARERDPENRAAIALARYAVAKALRALGRPGEAAAELEQAVAWTREAGAPDGWFHEELAETYAALDRTADASEHAELALSLLPGMDPSFESDEARVARLRELASPTAASG
jgi:tetratricopeptide (TPR) repeat protein